MAPRDQFTCISEMKAINDDSPDEDDDIEPFLNHTRRRRSSRSWLRLLLPWTAHATAIAICSFLLLSASSSKHQKRDSCTRKLNAYSPILDAVSDDDYQETRFKYSLWYKSPFKGPPTPEVEQAWQGIMQYGQISVTAEDIVRIGHNLTTAVKYPSSVADGGYPATAMGTHALHCLHYIWQDHYIAVSPDVQATKAEIPEMYERHYEHCVDYIRQYLMCKFDTTIMPFNWVLDHQNPTPNGNTVHKCVDWGALQGWLRGRAVEKPEDFEWRQPEDSVPLDWNP